MTTIESLATSLGKSLSTWYLENKRELPWRQSRDPYRIWISEVMLQQTTVQTVIPYFEKFIARFPDIKALAEAPLTEVLVHWAGLGYYSRARNLHRAAQELNRNGFSKTYSELIQLPGFGPYTSRAVSSIAFDEAVGVLDGNVIRILSRVYGVSVDWWTPKGRVLMQDLADTLVKNSKRKSSLVNQAMMELGATTCTPQKPNCLLCPWVSDCKASKLNQIAQFPRKKNRKTMEIWLWKPQVFTKSNQIALVTNVEVPFLKKAWIFPGSAKKVSEKPKSFDFKHGITHHQIYVQVQKGKPQDKVTLKTRSVQWVSLENLKRVNPSSLLEKVLKVKPQE